MSECEERNSLVGDGIYQCIPPEEPPREFILPPVNMDDSTLNFKDFLLPGSAEVIYFNNFKEADDYVKFIDTTSYISLRNLIWHLIFQHEWNDLNKVRILFSWLLNSRISGSIQFNGKYRPNSREGVFLQLNDRERFSLCFPKLFRFLCRLAGISCEIVVGYVKNKNYSSGESFASRGFNHLWNVVKIDSSWYLVDMHWNSKTGIVPVSHRTNILRKNQGKRPTFFIMDPYRAIYSHYPCQSHWQLLILRDPPLTLQQFEELPHIFDQFFQSGLSFKNSEFFGVQKTHGGCIKMELIYNSTAEFGFQLCQFTEGGLEQVVDGKILNAYGLLDTEESQISIYLRLPHEGVFYLTIFSRVIDDVSKLNQSDKMKPAITYTIVCSERCPKAAPITYFWDINCGIYWPLASHYGVKPMKYQNAVIPFVYQAGKEEENNLIIAFEKSIPTVTMIAKVRAPNKSGKTVGPRAAFYENSLCVECINKNKQSSMKIKLTEIGEFVCEIYIRDNDNYEMKSYELLAAYIIDCHDDDKHSILCDFVKEKEETNVIGLLPNPYFNKKPSRTTIPTVKEIKIASPNAKNE